MLAKGKTKTAKLCRLGAAVSFKKAPPRSAPSPQVDSYELAATNGTLPSRADRPSAPQPGKT